MTLLEYDEEYWSQGFTAVCGVDEAGRGPLAGPVYAAAVILPFGYAPDGLNDSKKLTAKKRERLYDEITQNALAYHIATAEVAEIDDLNILQASLLAMRRAVHGLERSPDLLLVDGNQDPVVPALPLRLVVKGDGTSAAIAAASILAKVARDRLLQRLDGEYPQYGFAGHKGYPTKEHYRMLDRYGPCPIHRRSFLKKWAAGRT